MSAVWTALRCLRLTCLFVFVLAHLVMASRSASAVNAASQVNQPASLTIENGSQVTLRGRDARLQLVVSGRQGDEAVDFDATHAVRLTAVPDGIVSIEQAVVAPLADGKVVITAEHASGIRAAIEVDVIDMGNESLVDFPGRIVPIFTKLGCNGGGCHGKAAGQNGFRLSLLGFEPQEDYEHLVRESRGRRLSLASPDRSLLLLKSLNVSPHGGGQRMTSDSHEYRLIRRWIAQGAPPGDSQQPMVTSIEVFPKQRRLAASSTQQLSVLAHLSDGTREDVTAAALYESNDASMADVTPSGLVTLSDLVGDVAVMARYQGHVTVFRADIPQGSRFPESASLIAEQSQHVVDAPVFRKLRSLGIPPAPLCDDTTYLRRVTLDLTGRLPTLEELDRFESDAASDKRKRLVTRLLASPDYAEFFAGKWNAILRNRRAGTELDYSTLAFHQWIRQSIDENKPYDQFAREIVTASGSVASHPPAAWFQQVPDTNQRIEDAAQLFLGQRIQCARCHHHPYEKWSQADYGQLAAFFATVRKKRQLNPNEPTFFAAVATATSRHPKTGKPLNPTGLDASPVAVPPHHDPRVAFADWMTDPQNPFFARAVANRYWKHFMGRGLVEPEDDLRVTNPPSNPELLDGLASELVASGYDLKGLIRSIVTSRVYQLDSEAVDENLSDRRSYSRFYPKRLQAEVLLDAIDRVTQSPTRFDGLPPGVRAVGLPDTGFESYFLNVFGRPASSTACECERSQQANLSQSLHLLNSDEMQSKLSDERGRAAQLAEDDSKTDADKVRQLYRVAFSRMPNDRELKTALAYLSGKENRREALEDVIWSLVNSKEFMFNH